MTDHPTLDWIDLDRFEAGTITPIWLDLIHDGLGRPMPLPVIVVKGAKPGPTLGLTSAVHGNEVNGMPVIHRLVGKLDPERLRGAVVAVPVVNVAGYLLHQRRTDDGFDLNHLFPGVPDGREAQVLAYRLFRRVIRRFDLLLDLHTASFGRINSLYVRADMTDPDTARMAYLQRPQIIVHNSPADGTLRGAAAAAGIPAVTVEIGNPHRFQRDLVKRTVVGVRAVMSAWGMLPRRQVALGDPPVLCRRSGWMFTDHGGFLDVPPKVAKRVEGGSVVATLVDVFGDAVATYKAPHDGIVIGKSVDPVASTGARILHLGELADDSDTHLLGRRT